MLPQIYCDPASKNVRKVLQHMDVDICEDVDAAEIIWMRHHYKPLFKTMSATQWLNHIPNEECIVNKGRLYHSLQQTDCSSFLQPSFRLTNAKEREQFLQQLPQTDNEKNLWIMKPCNLSKGVGVKILWQFDDFKKEVQKNKGRFHVKGKGEQDYIIQKYIRSPLLLEGRKSEMRIYWLIASLEPLTVLLYNEGTVRLNSQAYKLGDYDNQLIHVTNVYQQKQHPEYDSSIELKWTFEDLENYLLANRLIDKKNYIATDLLPKIIEIIASVVNANKNELRQNGDRKNYFELFGADIILDDTLTPWLAEVQKGPGLSHSDNVKKRVIPAMLYEMFNIMLEVRTRKLAKLPINDLQNLQNFIWVIKDGKAHRTVT